MELFAQLQPWHWFVLAMVLGMVEILATTGFFIGIALAALAMTGVLWVSPNLEWEWQLLWFALLSVMLTVAYMVLFRRVNDATDSPLLNNRAAQKIGEFFVLTADLDAAGAEMLGDTRWAIRCSGKLAKGTRVRVIASEEMTLFVEPA